MCRSIKNYFWNKSYYENNINEPALSWYRVFIVQGPISCVSSVSWLTAFIYLTNDLLTFLFLHHYLFILFTYIYWIVSVCLCFVCLYLPVLFNEIHVSLFSLSPNLSLDFRHFYNLPKFLSSLIVLANQP